ncbi:MAG: peptidase [Planctomycetes bacterium]|nr:peptidase [Planctomycetota bacterium]
MKNSDSHFAWTLVLGAWALVIACFASPAFAQKIRLKDGRILEGKTLPIPGVADNPIQFPSQEGETKSTPILLIDDDLRRVYVPKLSLASVISETPQPMVRINLSKWQNVARAGGTIGSVGPSLGITQFDKWGRRIYKMQTRHGPLAVVQGITELTPRYAKVEGLRGQPRQIVWDMRLATSSIPQDVLAEILSNAVSKDNPQDWMQIVSFYLQAERYGYAQRELKQLIRRFPEMDNLQTEVQRLRQLWALRLLKELELRREAGQHMLAERMLEKFPDEGVASETLQQVRETIEKYAADTAQLGQVQKLLQSLVADLGSDDQRKLIQPIIAEIVSDLNLNNLVRLVPFLQLADDQTLSAEERVALAINGWLLGGDGATQNFPKAVSLVKVREAVQKYLREPLAHERLTLLQSIESSEGAGVPDVAKLIAHMKPPWPIFEEKAPVGANQEFQKHGVFALKALGQTEHGDFKYLVQLPPEYDVYRRYPTLVVLNGAYNSPDQELSFWAGSPPRDETGKQIGVRNGQAMRRGYITIAVEWLKPQQYSYEYSLREHEALLACLRDATRRFSIDTDRVFLSGHGIGGDAAWDFAQSHPDMWAGVIPFVAKRDPVKKYIQFYWENARYVPLYFVTGEKDGQKMSQNAELFDRYLRKRFDTTVVEYLGRGQEPFHDEILHIFDWMALPNHHRTGSPREFQCKTMRPWDNYFWWLEGHEFPREVHPGQWPLPKARANQLEARILKQNLLSARTSCARTTIWLSPDLVDFSQPIEIKLNGKKLTKKKMRGSPQPELRVLLEDVRTRGDRIRPFWAKIEVP